MSAVIRLSRHTYSMDIFAAHRHSLKHRADIDVSASCACFNCIARFVPDDIKEWTDDGQTALCPRCGIDSVLGSASGVSLDTDFLKEMRAYWFGIH